MRFRNQTVEDDSGVNLTPLIDVVFLLLIFFMVSTTFDTTSELKIELPEASAQKKMNQKNPITILIDPRGFYYINGKRLKNTNAELLLLELHRIVGSDKDTPVVIQSDANSPVQSLVTALDIVGQMSMTHLSIATTKPLN
jgi:biopolymer transport protein ExbD